jgi:hypothetical protein
MNEKANAAAWRIRRSKFRIHFKSKLPQERKLTFYFLVADIRSPQ